MFAPHLPRPCWFTSWLLAPVLANQEKIMIDTSRILASVAAERTESASLRALVAANTATMRDLAVRLQAAIDANDPTAMAQVQADLDQAATDLDADNQAAADAITQNTTP